jgi:hypothetical protein
VRVLLVGFCPDNLLSAFACLALQFWRRWPNSLIDLRENVDFQFVQIFASCVNSSDNFWAPYMLDHKSKAPTT